MISRLPGLLVGSGLSLLHSSGGTHCTRYKRASGKVSRETRRTREGEGGERTDGSSSSSSGKEDVDGLARKSRGLDRVVDFGPGGEIVSERVSGVGVLVEDDGVRDSGAETFGDPEGRSERERV